MLPTSSNIYEVNIMAEKILNTRIQLKYDTWENWSKTDVTGKGGNLVLKAGEVAITAIQTGDSVKQTTPPTVMFKVGDGSTPFSGLPWASALAADVYAWAKKSSIEISSSGTGSFVTGMSWDSTNNKLNITKGNADLSGYVPVTRTIANIELTKDITKAALLTALNVADGATKVTESTVENWGFTKNTGTVTGVKMNGTTKSPIDGVVDLGSVITSHQDISGKQNKTISIENITATTVEGALKEINTSKYSKPNTGIPKTDLAADV